MWQDLCVFSSMERSSWQPCHLVRTTVELGQPGALSTETLGWKKHNLLGTAVKKKLRYNKQEKKNCDRSSECDCTVPSLSCSVRRGPVPEPVPGGQAAPVQVPHPAHRRQLRHVRHRDTRKRPRSVTTRTLVCQRDGEGERASRSSKRADFSSLSLLTLLEGQCKPFHKKKRQAKHFFFTFTFSKTMSARAF